MSENKKTTDSELLLQIIGYNAEAFEELCNRYSSTIYSLSKEIVSSPKLSEQILLNVFSVFLKRIEYYSTTSNNVFTYFTLLTRNIALDTFKRVKLVENIPNYTDEYEIDFILPNLSSVIDAINLDDRILLNEKMNTYRNQLSEVQNLVVSLVFFEGLSDEEIAKRLNVPAVTIRQKLITIMDILHTQHTGRKHENKGNNEILNLIKLEALGCISADERKLLNKMKDTDQDFLWNELGEYQNLTALLSTSVSVKSVPNDFKSEIRNIFTKAFGESKVDCYALESMPATTSINPILKPIAIPIPEFFSQKAEMPKTNEKKETEFRIKFRNPDPKGLSLLKKLEADKASQNNSSSVEINNPDLTINNDDPSIVIEDPELLIVKDDTVIKNILIPNSSINLKDLIKKDNPEIQRKFSTPNIDTKNATAQNKSAGTTAKQPDIKIRTNEPPKELKRIVSFVEKSNVAAQAKPVIPVVEKSEIKFKTNEPPKEFRRGNQFEKKATDGIAKNPVAPAINKPNISVGNNKLSEVVNADETIFQKNASQNKDILNFPVNSTPELKLKPANHLDSNNYLRPFVSQDDVSLQNTIPSVSKTSLKIRKTSFVESDIENVTPKQESKTHLPETTIDEEKIISIKKVIDSKNSDKLLDKSKEAKPESFSNDVSYKEKIKQTKKNSKRKFFVAAAFFAIMIVSGAFVYLDLQSSQVKIAGKIRTPEKLVVNAQNNFVLQNAFTEPTTSGEVKEAVEGQSLDIKKTDAKISLPPLPENLSKEESTYFALNENSNLINNPIRENRQIAAAKTEKIIPPKEDKKIEEEPAFFVAVEEMPELIGGIKGLQSKIVYPKIAEKTGTEGKVLVQAMVDESGEVLSVKTIKGIGAGCDEVALDAVLNSKFKPGKQRGKNVKVQVTIPIMFKK